jgi:hypothetical protein
MCLKWLRTLIGLSQQRLEPWYVLDELALDFCSSECPPGAKRTSRNRQLAHLDL